MTQGQHRATARVLDILESLSGSEEGLTLTELSQALDAPKSSLFPIVHTLEERRYLRQDDGTGRYTMGPRALVLGAAFSADRGLAPITQVMKEVASKCQETCQMGILDQDRVLYVAREDSPQPIRLISWVWTRLPANATAVGKALLSGLTNEEVRALYAGGLPRLTEQTITDVETLLAQLEAVRRGELAMAREESTDQLACWAAPLRRKGTVFAALSISVPLFRCREEKIELVRRSPTAASLRIPVPSLKALRHRKPTTKITSHLVMTGSSLDSITTKALLAPRRTSVRSCFGSLTTARPVKWTLLSQNPSAASAGTQRTA